MSLDPDEFGDLRLKGFIRDETPWRNPISKEQTHSWPLYLGGTIALIAVCLGVLILAMCL